MGTAIFPYRVWYPRGADLAGHGPTPRMLGAVTESGIDIVRLLDPAPPFVIPEAVIVLDGTTDDALQAHTYASYRTWMGTTTSWGATSCLFKALYAVDREVSGESIGTATGGGGGVGETFTLAKKFVHHTDFGESVSTLVVKVVGVVQTLTTDYTVSGNGTAPTITATATMDAGVVTADYEFYHQVRIRHLDVRQPKRDKGLANPGIVFASVSIREVVPGGHLA